MTNEYTRPGVEPSVDELLNDPITQAIMHYDGITADMVTPLLWERFTPSLLAKSA